MNLIEHPGFACRCMRRRDRPIYDAKTFAYDASKAALNSFTIHLAHELKDTKIKVNSAHPGWVKTDMGGDAAPLDVVDGREDLGGVGDVAG